MSWIPRLFTERQREHYQVLARKNLPSCLGGNRLFEDPECAVHFMQAFFKIRCESPRDEWSLVKIFRKIRDQAAAMTPQRCAQYVDAALRMFHKEKINLGSMMLPFSALPDSMPQATRVLDLLLDIMLAPEIEASRMQERSLPLRYIILMPTQIGTWYCFMRLIRRQDPEALVVLDRLIRFVALSGAEPEFISDHSFPLPSDNPPWSILGPALQSLFRPASLGHSAIPVPSDCVGICRSSYQGMLQRYQKRVTEVAELVSVFRDREEQYRIEMARMWQDILESTCWGLRPDGQDIAHIGISQLQRQGLRDIQFFPQPDAFGHVIARFWMQIDDSGLEIKIDRDIRPRCELEPFSDRLDVFLGTVQKLHRYLAVYGLWRILTGKVPRAWSECRAAGNGNNKFYRLPPRPHYPKLPPGKQATRRAFERAAEMHRNPPPAGRTFAKSDRSAPIEVNPRQRPVLVLTDRDLQL